MEEQIGIGFSWLCLFFSPKISENREETQKNKKHQTTSKKTNMTTESQLLFTERNGSVGVIHMCFSGRKR
jgi:hypothetical protein